MNLRSVSISSAIAIACAAIPACKSQPAPSTTPAPTVASAPIAPTPKAPQPPADLFPLDDAKLAKIVNPGGAPAYSGATATIEGTIKVEGDPSPLQHFNTLPDYCKLAGERYAPLFRKAADGALADALVSVIGVSGFVPLSRADKIVTIKECGTEPRTIDLSLGQRLLMRNEDKGIPYMPQVGERKSVTNLAIEGQAPVALILAQPNIYAMTWLAGAAPGSAVPTDTVFVIPSALHVVTGVDGHYKITGIPVGKARLTATHRSLLEVHEDLDLKENETRTVNLTLKFTTPAPAASSSASKIRSEIR
jgi:hypothetical protein